MITGLSVMRRLGFATSGLPNLGGIIVPRDLLLSELQLNLMERVEWWKAEARRYLREQKDHIARASEDKAPVEATGSKSAERTAHLDASADYRSISFRGQRYTLTKNQSEIIKVLDQALRVGRPDVYKRADQWILRYRQTINQGGELKTVHRAKNWSQWDLTTRPRPACWNWSGKSWRRSTRATRSPRPWSRFGISWSRFTYPT